MTITITKIPTLNPQLTDLLNLLNQHRWATFTANWHLSSHLLVAHNQDHTLLGFLRYVTQPIGPELDLPPTILNGRTLTEAKVLAFGVHPNHRRQGIGRQLQQTLIHQASAANCHQIRSHSSAENTANHQLKLSLGFGAHPLPTENGRDGYYFLLPLTINN